MEFLSLMENRRVLAGRDALEGLQAPTRHLRHQVEYELRGKLIRLRRLYVPASASPARLSSLLTESLATFAHLFQFALVLAGANAPASHRETVRAAISHFALDASPFDRIQASLDSGKPIPEAEAHACFGAYMEQIERVIGAVDRMPGA
jgi:hypothetical protein